MLSELTIVFVYVTVCFYWKDGAVSITNPFRNSVKLLKLKSGSVIAIRFTEVAL